MRKLLPALIIIFISYAANAQQLHFTSQYLQHNLMYNPAAAGISEISKIGVTYRSMWSSFPGNPKTYMLYADAELKKLNAGLGGYVYRDETGPTSRTGVQLAYSYHIKAKNDKSRFGIGLEARGLQYAIDKSKLSSSLGNDPVLAGSENKTAFDAGFGLYWTNRKLSVGAGAQQLIGSKIEFGNVQGGNIDGRLYRHYNFTANYRLQTGDDIYLIPNLMVRVIENSPSEYNFGVRANYQEKVWWGLNWQVRQFWSIQAGFRLLQRVSATYSYDYYVTPISVFQGGSGAHEIGLQFDLKKK